MSHQGEPAGLASRVSAPRGWMGGCVDLSSDRLEIMLMCYGSRRLSFSFSLSLSLSLREQDLAQRRVLLELAAQRLAQRAFLRRLVPVAARAVTPRSAPSPKDAALSASPGVLARRTVSTLGERAVGAHVGAGPKKRAAFSLVRDHSPCVCGLRLPSRSSYPGRDENRGDLISFRTKKRAAFQAPNTPFFSFY